MYVFQLGGTAAGQAMVQVLPSPGQRLMPRDRLGPQPLAVGTGNPGQQLLVERVAIGRDLGHEHSQRRGRGMRLRPAAAGGRGHQDGAGQHSGRFEQQLFGRKLVRRFNPREQRVERDLLQHEAAVAALVVDVVGIPLAEVVVGPLIDRMVEVVLPRVDGQLVEQIEVEPGLALDCRVGGQQDFLRQADQPFVAAGGHAHRADVER